LDLNATFIVKCVMISIEQSAYMHWQVVHHDQMACILKNQNKFKCILLKLKVILKMFKNIYMISIINKIIEIFFGKFVFIKYKLVLYNVIIF
jgi:hypothetical protein